MMMQAIEDWWRARRHRPRCKSALGVHAWTCILAGLLMTGEPIVPNCRNRRLPGKKG